MTTEALLSTAVTNIDAVPPVRATAGKGGAARLKEVDAYITPTTGKTTGSTYRMVRVPSNCVVKRLTGESHGTITTMTMDVGVYYSDATIDETGSSSTLGTGAVDADFFGSAVVFATGDTPYDVTNESGTYDVSKRNKELWDAAGLSTDPGGFLDICFTSTATHNFTAGAVLGLRVEFASPQQG